MGKPRAGEDAALLARNATEAASGTAAP